MPAGVVMLTVPQVVSSAVRAPGCGFMLPGRGTPFPVMIAALLWSKVIAAAISVEVMREGIAAMSMSNDANADGLPPDRQCRSAGNEQLSRPRGLSFLIADCLDKI